MSIDGLTEIEMDAYMKMIRSKSIDYEFDAIEPLTFDSSDGQKPYPDKTAVLFIDDRHWPKMTPWLNPTEYGTRYQIICNAPAMHPLFNINLRNDETGESYDFCIVICPLEFLASNGFKKMLLPAFEAFVREVNFKASSGEPNPRRVSFLLVSNIFKDDLKKEGLKAIEPSKLAQNPNYFERLCSRFVAAENIDISPFLLTISSLFDETFRSMPMTETFVRRVSGFPCNRCDYAVDLMRKNDMIKPDIGFSPEMRKRIQEIADNLSERMVRDRK